MDTRLTKHLDKDQIKSYRNAFDALKEILTAEFRKKEAVRDYSPGWELKQVAVNEYNQVVDDIIKLLTLTKE